MSFTVTIRGRDDVVQVEMGQTILEAAIAQGLPYPHGCRSGNCGACKSELISGDVEMSPFSDYALSKGEKDQGLILACRSVPWSDCEVAWLEADDQEAFPQRRLVCTVAEMEQATHDIKVVRLKVESGGPFDFAAGQYAQVAFADLPARDYSMANRPDQDFLEFHIRLVDGGTVSPHVANGLKVGDEVRVEGPYGTSYLRRKHRGPILAVAGGSGLAPVKSIVETALAGGTKQPIHLYFGVRAERDLYLEDHFARLAAAHDNLTFVPVLSEPEGPTDRRTGYVGDAVAADVGDLDGTKAYLAGPPVMVETATEKLKSLGLRRQDCHADAFYTEAEKNQLDEAS